MDQQTLRDWEQRCIQEEQPFCQAACPLHVDARAMLDKLARGEADAARRILERSLPLPGVLGRICEAPCQARCKRTEAGEPLAIGQLERFLVAHAKPGPRPLRLPGRGLHAEIFGRGLAALTCAWDLLKKGHDVTLRTLGKPLGQPLGGALLDRADPALMAALARELDTLAALGLVVDNTAYDVDSSGAVPKDSALPAANYSAAGIPLDGALLRLLAAALAGNQAGDQAENMAENQPVARAVFLEWGWSTGTDAVYPPRAAVDPVTLAGAVPGLFLGMFLGGWPDADGRFSAIQAAADGRRAASSMDRQLTGASLTASREREGAVDTRLFTSLEGVQPLPRVQPAGAQYDSGEASREADRCLRCQCLECVKVCTYLEHFKGYPKLYARQIYNNAAIVKGQHLSNPLVNACSLCGLCGRVCPEGFEMAELCLTARREMVAAGTMPPSAHEFALEDMAAASGPECALLRPDPAMPAGGSAAHLFFPGCQLAASHPQHVRSVYNLLRAQLTGGVGLMLRCCGIPANWAGREDLFASALTALRADWEALGQPRIIAACAGCLSVLRDFAPDIPAESLWETLARLALPPRPAGPLPGPLALHDPCTARSNAPFRLASRALAARLGLDLRELALSGELTECCGFGGLMSAAKAPLGREVAARRAGRSPLDYVATCAMCRDRLAAEGKRAWHLLDFVFPGQTPESALQPGPGPSARREARARLKRELLSELWGEFWGESPEDVTEGAETHAVEGQGASAILERGIPALTSPTWANPALAIPADILARLEERRILASDLRQAVREAEASGRWFADAATGRRLAAFRPRRVTFWAQYQPQGAGFVLENGWSHRMVVPGLPGPAGDGAQSGSETLRHSATVQRADQTYLPEDGAWACACSGPASTGPSGPALPAASEPVSPGTSASGSSLEPSSPPSSAPSSPPTLAARAVDVTYLGSVFTISLLTCPACGLPLVPEALALGRMAEVEQLLEDK